MHKIHEAVFPLKEAAIIRAAKEAQIIVDRCAKQLAEGGFDLNVVAPYPKYGSYTSTAHYHQLAARNSLFRQLVTTVLKDGLCRRPNDPHIVQINAPSVAKFIKNAEDDAAFQYDQFIIKLIGKIGNVTEASLSGDHVWSFSILTVTKEDGSVEKWKTQMIVNCSKHGKLFNQFPTRKVK